MFILVSGIYGCHDESCNDNIVIFLECPAETIVKIPCDYTPGEEVLFPAAKASSSCNDQPVSITTVYPDQILQGPNIVTVNAGDGFGHIESCTYILQAEIDPSLDLRTKYIGNYNGIKSTTYYHHFVQTIIEADTFSVFPGIGPHTLIIGNIPHLFDSTWHSHSVNSPPLPVLFNDYDITFKDDSLIYFFTYGGSLDVQSVKFKGKKI